MSNTPSDLTLAGLVHDLCNVFETINDAADLLDDDPKQVRLAATIRRSVNRGTRILNSFAESSRALHELDAILDGATESARDYLHAVRGPEIEFVRNVEGGLRLDGHPAAWERVFVNLFMNAAQAMDGGGTVEITARASDEGIEILVEDCGPGISPKVLPNIFQPRFSTRAKRSGLGLHIVQTIVKEHRGAVTASNRPSGQGARFHIQLPRP
jgi:signal transduction histidine kinase